MVSVEKLTTYQNLKGNNLMKKYVASTQCGQKHFVESDSIITAKRMFTEMLKGLKIVRIEAAKPEMFADVKNDQMAMSA